MVAASNGHNRDRIAISSEIGEKAKVFMAINTEAISQIIKIRGNRFERIKSSFNAHIVKHHIIVVVNTEVYHKVVKFPLFDE